MSIQELFNKLENHAPTLRDLWRPIIPKQMKEPTPDMPAWPPDLFALCGYAVRREARYIRVLTASWSPCRPEKKWAEHVSKLAREWLAALRDEQPAPDEVAQIWKSISAVLDKSEREASADQPLLQMMAVTDEICKYADLRKSPNDDDALELDAAVFRLRMELAMQRNQRSSICESIPAASLRVLLKNHVPQRGLTLRSMSLYAGLVEGTELQPRIERQDESLTDDVTLNVLLLPWPLEMHPSQFREDIGIEGEVQKMPPDFGFFTVAVETSHGELAVALNQLIDNAIRDIGEIGLVILPELALPDSTAKEIAHTLSSRAIGFIAGVSRGDSSSGKHASNLVSCTLPNSNTVEQHKHHPWKLDRNQICQYSLGSMLDPSRDWWEHIDISNRTLTFVHLKKWLRACVLICEDLARPDPAGDILRTVGLDLTVALLMDGPQVGNRWSARHALTLAEDPGGSVLTLTSLGMSALSRPRQGVPDRRRVVALWQEPNNLPVEIELPPGKDAAVLSLSMKPVREWSADGRSRTSAIPSLTGVRFFSWPAPSVRVSETSYSGTGGGDG